MTEYAQILVLKEDVKRLELEKRLMASCHAVEMKEAAGEVARLKAEVERLRKAGDAMQKRLIFLHDRWDSDEPNIESEAWNAAKEGKPQS